MSSVIHAVDDTSVKTVDTLHAIFGWELYEKSAKFFRQQLCTVLIEQLPEANDLLTGYGYPLIQFKKYRGFPMLLVLGSVTKSIKSYCDKHKEALGITHCISDKHNIELSATQNYTYRLKDWLALNQKNYQRYKRLPSMVDKVAFLEKKLCAQLLSFAKGIDWFIRQRINVQIKDVRSTKSVVIGGVRQLVFDLDFSVNIALPEYIGLGKGARKGNGILLNT